MTYTMKAKVKAVPAPADVISALGPDVASSELTPTRWPTEQVRFHHVGKSTCGFLVKVSPRAVLVHIPDFANESDWEVTFAFLGAIGADLITGDDDTSASLANARAEFREPLLEHLAGAITAVQTLAAQGSTIAVQGAVREAFIGERTATQLQSPIELLEAVRRVQYIEREGFEFVPYVDLAKIMSLTVDYGFCIWRPEVAQAFGPTAFLGVASTRQFYIPVDVLPSLLGKRFAWLDERQFAIRATPAAELAPLIERATKFAFDPQKKLRTKPRKRRG